MKMLQFKKERFQALLHTKQLFIYFNFNLERENDDENVYIWSTKEEKRKTHQTIKEKKLMNV